MLKELNDNRMKAQAQLRIAMHHLPDTREADVAVEAVDTYMESVHVLIEEMKNQVRLLKQGEI